MPVLPPSSTCRCSASWVTRPPANHPCSRRSLPVKSGTCTRMPITVRCRNGKEEGVWLLSRDGSERKLDPASVGEEILEAQAETVKQEDGKDFSKSSLRLEARGPEQMELILVDLPGLIHNGPDVETVTQMIKNFVSRPQALLLLVGEAKQDTELAGALALATEYDPHGRRTLRVLSKFDTFDSEDSRATACKTIIKQSAQMLGAHAVVCRVAGALKYDEESELDALRSSFPTVDDGLRLGDPIACRLSVPALKARLPSIFERLIRQNLPDLMAQAEAKLAHAERQIALLGDHPITPTEMLVRAQTILRNQSPSFTQIMTPAMNQFREDVHAALSTSIVTEEFTRGHFTFDAFKTPFFQGESAFESAMRDLVQRLSRSKESLLNKVEAHFGTAMEPLERESAVASRLRAAVNAAWAQVSVKILASLSEKAYNLLNEITAFGTQNHYLYEKYIETEVFPDKLMEKIASGLGIVRRLVGENFEWEFKSTDDHLSASQIMHSCEQARESIAADTRQASVEQHCAERLHSAVQAHCAVEKKNLSDAMLKAVRDIAVKGLDEFMHVTLFAAPEIGAEACEDAAVEQQRKELHGEVASMLSVLKEIKALVMTDLKAAPTPGEAQAQA